MVEKILTQTLSFIKFLFLRKSNWFIIRQTIYGIEIGMQMEPTNHQNAFQFKIFDVLFDCAIFVYLFWLDAGVHDNKIMIKFVFGICSL